MSSTSETMDTAVEHHQALDSLQGKPAHFPFLDLSRELRDRVYIEVLKSRVAVSPPSLSDVSQQGNRKNTRDEPLSCIIYAPFPAHTVSSAPCLLLLNRQVHGEVKQVLSERRREIRPLTYTLDCMAVHAGVLFPTWLSVPILSSNVDIVETNLRLCRDHPERYYHPTGWVVGNGGPARMIWNLLALLNRFLSRGADFLSELPKATSTTVGLLVLNVVTPPEGVLPVFPVEEEEDCETPFEAMPVEEEEDRETLFEDIVEWIGHFIGILLHDDHGKMTREKVRMIRLCVDGQEKRTFDVSLAIKNLERSGRTG